MRANVRNATTEPGVAPAVGRGRWRWRRTWALACAVAGASPAVAFVVLHALMPSDGAHLRPGASALAERGAVVSPLGREGGALQEGDLVVAVGGVPLPQFALRLVGGAAPDGAAARGAEPGLADRVAAVRAAWRSGGPLAYDVVRDGAPLRLEVALGPHPLGAVVARTWGTILFALVNLLVLAVVFARRPDHPPAQVLFAGAGALIGATAWSFGLHLGDLVGGTGFWLFQLATVVAFGAYWTSVAHFAAVFPTPLPVARRRSFAPVLYGASLLVVLAHGAVLWARTPDPFARIAGVGAFTGAHAAAFLALALAATFVQYRRSLGAARAQIRWVVLAAWVAGVAGLGLYLLPPLLGAAPVSPNAIGILATAFPIGVAVAVLHHRLFDIDAILNRALVYGALTLAIGAAYVAVVTVLGGAVQVRGGALAGLVAAGVVAILVQPLRTAVQRGVDRLMYGQRDDPAAVLRRLGERLEATLAPDAVLPTLVATVADALRLPYVAIELATAGRVRTAAAFGRPRWPSQRFPLGYRGEPLGHLIVEPRGVDEAFSDGEVALLETIARQAGVAAYALRATEALRRSRERLVAAREEERRRLRRDLHDGVGPALAGLALKLDAASNVVARDADAARRLLHELRGEVEGAITDLRGVVHALRPPALDDLGLVAALREQARARSVGGLVVDLEVPDALPPLPAAVEVAAFRIAQEALTNVVRHASARRCRIVLAVDDALTVTVEDDGVGIARGTPRAGAGPDAESGARSPALEASGVGLSSMRERAVELGGDFAIGMRAGGGTRLVARLPLGTPELEASAAVHATPPHPPEEVPP
jgi:two-component system, NarL family, sensor kinase